eukprot:scaffold659_cov71-Cylindrotheca_fusiformis.AAC.7
MVELSRPVWQWCLNTQIYSKKAATFFRVDPARCHHPQRLKPQTAACRRPAGLGCQLVLISPVMSP